ncbi:lactate dehydrogenase [Vagococcus penaei]|uniref:Lactate dehydrogenase n=1 Tax=Vagococcus penaei TaxID=633807 RepID=A0A1Q2D3Z5_9ENTE|nr:lactate dehydrogenase [Vagococcus penaei]AQP53007.1 lactate dehydrogenase [Vagococcus penaei]RSU02533.1 lactate dehydrogenase [Vagococcus penaei]
MKVSIIGAGAVGATTAFSLAKSALVQDLVIVDLDERKAKGIALDILHGLSLSHNLNITAGDYSDTANSDVIIVTIGVPEKVGESRLIPLQKNADILKTIIPQITEASPNGILLLVSNPVDILAYFAQQISGWNPERVIGLGTTLDSARLNYLLARDWNLAQTDVNGLVIGEHGDSQVVAWSQTAIKGTQFDDFIQANGFDLPENYHAELAQEVKDTAFDVWEMKGPNCYCVALAIEKVVKAIALNENVILPISQPFLEDVYISLPHIINRNGVVRPVNLSYTQAEQEKLELSYKNLSDTAAQIKL